MKHFPLNPHARTASRAGDLRRSLVLWRALGALLVGGAAVVAVSQASATASAPTDGAHVGHPGHHQGAKRHGEHMPGHGLPFSGRGFERLLDEVKATDAQRQQIRQIASKAQSDLQALRHEARESQHHGMAVWTSPKLDAAEAEKLRQQMLAHHDRVSKRMMQAMLDVGQVLSPEQRAQAAQIMQKRQAHRRDKLGARHGDPREGRQGMEHEAVQPAAAARNERARDHMLRRPVAPAPASSPAAGSAAPASGSAPATSSR